MKFLVLVLLFPILGSSQKLDLPKHLSDSFIADVGAGRIEAAVQKWHKRNEDDFERKYADDFAKAAIESMIKRCGQPAGATVLNNGNPELGTLIAREKHIPQYIFVYSARTPHGLKRFDVTVQADANSEYHIAGFGCGNIPSGKR